MEFSIAKTVEHVSHATRFACFVCTRREKLRQKNSRKLLIVWENIRKTLFLLYPLLYFLFWLWLNNSEKPKDRFHQKKLNHIFVSVGF